MALMMLSFEAKIVNGNPVRADRLYKNHPVIINGIVGELIEAEFVNDPETSGKQMVRVVFLFYNPVGHYTQEHVVDREFTFQTLDIVPIEKSFITEQTAAEEPVEVDEATQG